MRWIPVFFALSVSLSAADPDVLARAVADFAHEEQIVREAASRRVDDHLRRVLAPLVEGLDAADPEVRRRCRAAILGLVPRAPRPDEEEDRARAVLLGRRQAVAVVVRGRPTEFQLREMRAFGVVATLAKAGLAVEVIHGRIADELGLRDGDVVLRVNGEAVNGFGDLVDALGVNEDGRWRRTRLRVVRGADLLNLPPR